jgi:oxygen-independent coproporphyrinogen III oxidase
MIKAEIRKHLYQSMVSLYHDSFLNPSDIKEFNHVITTDPYTVYIHFPFCKSACKWCVYRKTVNMEHIDKYCESVVKEIEMWAQNPARNKKSLNSMYFGGGTPTLMPIKHLEKILNTIFTYFPPKENIQITIEANPNSVNPDSLDAYKSLGINRMSIGGQSFQKNVLQEMKRSHSPEQLAQAIELVNGKGFELGVDLLIGFDSQNTAMVVSDVQRCIDLGASTVSLNILSRQSMTDGERGQELKEKQMEMYHVARKLLMANDFNQYTIEEFTKSDPCHYLKDIWSIPSRDLVSFGAGCFGWIGLQKYVKKNLKPYMEHIESIRNKEFPLTFYRYSQEQEIANRLFIGLHCLKVDRKIFLDAFHIDPVQLPVVSLLKDLEIVSINDDFIQLTEKGIFDFGEMWSLLYFTETMDVLKR